MELKRFLSRCIPSRESIENHKLLRRIRHRLDDKPYLWDFNQATVVRATFIGAFWAMMPMPFQILPAVLLALFFRANILVAVAWVWVSNPFTMLPILYCSYFLGCKILGVHFTQDMLRLDLAYLLQNWRVLLLPLLLGSIAFGVICSVIFSALVWAFYQLKGNRSAYQGTTISKR